MYARPSGYLLTTAGPKPDFYLKNDSIPLSSLIKTSILLLISCSLVLPNGRNKSVFWLPLEFTCMTTASYISYSEPCIPNGCLLEHGISGFGMPDKRRVPWGRAGVVESGNPATVSAYI